MTHTHFTRSRVLRRIGVAVAATIAVSTMASTGSQAASKPTAKSKYGGSIKVAIFDSFPGFCFGDNNANSALMVERTIYEGLFEKTRGGDMIGLLAKSATPDSTLKVWTVKLRPNITFSDGAKFDADAVVKNFTYSSGAYSTGVAGAEAASAPFVAYATKLYTAFVSPKSASNPLGGTTGTALLGALGLTGASATKAVGTISFYAVVGTFKDGGKFDISLGTSATGGTLKALGLDQAASTAWAASVYTLSTSTAFTGNMKAIEAVDPLTVKFTMNRAQNDVPAMLYASGRAFMRSPAQFTNGATVCSQKPIGTGPFKVADDYKLSDTNNLTVVKNPTYWRTDPVTKAKLPYLDKITFNSVKEASQRAAAVRRGTYAAAMFGGGGEATFVKDLRLRKSVVTEYKSPNEYYPSLWLNQGKTGSPFASKNARLAVLSCIDRVNYVKVRTKGESVVAESLVGPTNVMYTKKGWQKFDTTASKAFVAAWQAEPGNAGKTLSFIIPADTSSTSKANAQFFIDTWDTCGIKVTMDVREAAQIIGKTFNSSETGAAQNGYDAIFILLFEGTDVAFNLPFAVSTMFPAGATTLGSTWATSVGTVLSLNHHKDTALDDLFYAGQAAANKNLAKLKYQEATAKMQTEGYMGSVAHGYYNLFVNKAAGLGGIGTLQIEKGKTQRLVTNWGIDWTGVYLTK